MRPQDNFNIITGEVKQNYPLNSTSKRFASLDLIKNQKIKGGYKYNMLTTKRLGHSKDQKMFVYTYTATDPINNIYASSAYGNNIERNNQIKSSTLLQQSGCAAKNQEFFKEPFQQKTSLINATKLEYNIISNTYQNDMIHPRNWNQTKRKFPISKFVHDGRTYAPNYSQSYTKTELDKQFSRKRNLCTDICEIQKTYGTGKFFRKFK